MSGSDWKLSHTSRASSHTRPLLQDALPASMLPDDLTSMRKKSPSPRSSSKIPPAGTPASSASGSPPPPDPGLESYRRVVAPSACTTSGWCRTAPHACRSSTQIESPLGRSIRRAHFPLPLVHTGWSCANMRTPPGVRLIGSKPEDTWLAATCWTALDGIHPAVHLLAAPKSRPSSGYSTNLVPMGSRRFPYSRKYVSTSMLACPRLKLWPSSCTARCLFCCPPVGSKRIPLPPRVPIDFPANRLAA
mmetsp:Transcript_31357/g.100038  ORF Transcript_31357/g.100038 Transcript_31357/m.100038 type:complete len:247 (+) Transcript_31357:731-1471(+)